MYHSKGLLVLISAILILCIGAVQEVQRQGLKEIKFREEIISTLENDIVCYEQLTDSIQTQYKELEDIHRTIRSRERALQKQLEKAEKEIRELRGVISNRFQQGGVRKVVSETNKTAAVTAGRKYTGKKVGKDIPTEDRVEHFKWYCSAYAVTAKEEVKYRQSKSPSCDLPPSVQLAQAFYESWAGLSKIGTKNNHFGIKYVKGSKIFEDLVDPVKPYGVHNDDAPTDKFAYFISTWHGWRAYSRFMLQTRYAGLHSSKPISYEKARELGGGFSPKESLLKLEIKKGKEVYTKITAEQYWDMYVFPNWDDPELKWAHGLSCLGYATSGRYGHNISKIIRTYNLTQYD